MSKEKQPSAAPGAQTANPPAGGAPGATPASSNWFLPNFMTVTKAAGLRPTITLNVGGLLVAGELIDAQTFFTDLANITNEELKDAVSAEALARLTALFADFRDRADKPGNAADQSAVHEPTHIHLRNARVYQPGGAPVPAAGGVPWRVRLDAVDGFSLEMPALR